MSIPLRVLIVEDSEDDTLLLVRELRRSGYAPTFERVYAPESFAAALAGRTWDIVIADYALPHFSGLDALRMLRETDLDLPCIIVSGTIGEDIAVDAMRAGAHDYVMKGNLARLIPAVRRELREAEVRRARRMAEERLRTRERFLECLSGVAQQLLQVGGLSESLPSVLRSLGETAQVSRVYLFENYLSPAGELVTSQRYEWGAPGIEPQIDNPGLRGLSYVAAGFTRWIETLGHGGVIAGHVQDFPESERAILEAQDIRSILAIPLFVAGDWYGFIGFDVCDRLREWQQVEIDLLQTAAGAITSAIERDQIRRREQSLASVAAVLTSTLDFEQVLDRILEQVSTVVPHDAANIMLVEGERVRIVRWRGYERFGAEEFVSSFDFGISEMPNLGHMRASQEPLVIPDTTAYRGWVDTPVQRWLRSYAAAPIIVRGEVIGFLNVDSSIPGFFTQAQLVPLRAFADHTAAAIENARLFQEANRRVAELDTVRRASLRLTSSLELHPVLNAILDQAFSLVSADNAHIFLYDGARLTFGAAWWEDRSRQEPFAEPRPDGLTFTVARSGERIIVPDMKMHPLFRGQSCEGAILGLPLRVGDQIVGVMSVAFDQPHTFSENELRVLGLLADQAAIAIRNARLYQETCRQAKRLTALIEIGSDISATLDLPTVLERIAMHARDLLDADDSDVYLLQPDGETLRAIVALGAYADEIKAAPLRLGEGIVGYVAQSGEAEIVEHTGSDVRAVQVPGTPEEDGALMCAPLIFKSRVMGVMSLARSSERGTFQRDDLDFLVGLARQAAIAIENAKLYATEQQRAAELARALEQQRELDRLKDEFVQNVSHELRTPLSIARGYAELLADGDLGELRPEQREPVMTIARRVKMLSKLVDDLTAIMEVGSRELDRKPVDFAALVHDLVDDFRVVTEERGISLTTRIEPDVRPIFGDAVHLRRVLDNLLGNAVKFTPSGGHIAVRLRQGGESLVLEIQDSGIGIPPDELERIFDRFYQVDGSMSRRYGGAGLGLALVKEIVAAHGGQVTVESRVGEGSTFTVTLPLDK